MDRISSQTTAELWLLRTTLPTPQAVERLSSMCGMNAAEARGFLDKMPTRVRSGGNPTDTAHLAAALTELGLIAEARSPAAQSNEITTARPPPPAAGPALPPTTARPPAPAAGASSTARPPAPPPAALAAPALPALPGAAKGAAPRPPIPSGLHRVGVPAGSPGAPLPRGEVRMPTKGAAVSEEVVQVNKPKRAQKAPTPPSPFAAAPTAPKANPISVPSPAFAAAKSALFGDPPAEAPTSSEASSADAWGALSPTEASPSKQAVPLEMLFSSDGASPAPAALPKAPAAAPLVGLFGDAPAAGAPSADDPLGLGAGAGSLAALLEPDESDLDHPGAASPLGGGAPISVGEPAPTASAAFGEEFDLDGPGDAAPGARGKGQPAEFDFGDASQGSGLELELDLESERAPAPAAAIPESGSAIKFDFVAPAGDEAPARTSSPSVSKARPAPAAPSAAISFDAPELSSRESSPKVAAAVPAAAKDATKPKVGAISASRIEAAARAMAASANSSRVVYSDALPSLQLHGVIIAASALLLGLRLEYGVSALVRGATLPFALLDAIPLGAASWSVLRLVESVRLRDLPTLPRRIALGVAVALALAPLGLAATTPAKPAPKPSPGAPVDGAAAEKAPEAVAREVFAALTADQAAAFDALMARPDDLDDGAGDFSDGWQAAVGYRSLREESAAASRARLFARGRAAGVVGANPKPAELSIDVHPLDRGGWDATVTSANTSDELHLHIVETRGGLRLRTLSVRQTSAL